MENKLCFVQFLHPGGEHKPDDGLIKKWNTKSHQRKFLRQAGRYVADGKVEKGKMLFWGEWEPESKVTEVDGPVDQGPRFIYEPYYVVPKPCDRLQNTDPFVFGEQFHYTVCLQPDFPQLRHLSKGSVILFGSCKDHAFVLDTVFVVDEWIDYIIANYAEDLAGAISQEYEEVTILPLYWELIAESKSCSRRKRSCTPPNAEQTWRLYFGASHVKRVHGMYSFFPCQRYDVNTGGFPRPRISLSEIADEKSRGIKRTYIGRLDEMKLLWDKVVEQVKDQGLAPGVYAEMPDRRTDRWPTSLSSSRRVRWRRRTIQDGLDRRDSCRETGEGFGVAHDSAEGITRSDSCCFRPEPIQS